MEDLQFQFSHGGGAESGAGWSPLGEGLMLSIESLQSSPEQKGSGTNAHSKAPSSTRSKSKKRSTDSESKAKSKRAKKGSIDSAPAKPEAPAKPSVTLLNLSSDDLSLEEMEAMLAGDEEEVVEKQKRSGSRDQMQDEHIRSQFSKLMAEVWVRSCKESIDASLSFGLDAYEETKTKIVGLTQRSVSVFLKPADYDTLRMSLRSIGIETHGQRAEFQLNPGKMELVSREEEKSKSKRETVAESDSEWPIAIVKIYRHVWRPNGKQALFVNKEAQNLFGYSPNEFYKIWTCHGLPVAVKTPLWAHLIAEEDWTLVAENGCRDLLKLPRKNPVEQPAHAVKVRTKNGDLVKCVTSTKTNYHDQSSSKGPHSFCYCFVPLPEGKVTQEQNAAENAAQTAALSGKDTGSKKGKQKRAAAVAALASSNGAGVATKAGTGTANRRRG